MSIRIYLSDKEYSQTKLVVDNGMSKITWPHVKLWTKLNKDTSESIYGPLNEYFATLLLSKQNDIMDVYMEAANVALNSGDSEEVNRVLTKAAKDLYDLIDWNHLTKWALEYGGIAYNDDIHDVYTGEYPRVKTYLKDEYNDLVILSFYFKMMTPLWNAFIFQFSNIDAEFKDMAALDLLKDSGVHEHPAMLRLKEYCEALATGDAKNKNLAPAIYRNIGSNEMPRYFLAMLIVRRLSIGEIRNPQATLIKIAYKFLESKMRTLTNGVIDKKGARGDDERSETIAEQYRITQRVPDYAIDIAEAWVEENHGFTRTNSGELISTGIGLTEKNYERWIDLITDNPEDYPRILNIFKVIYNALTNNSHFVLRPYHMRLTALICKEKINPRSIYRFSRETRLILVSYAICWLDYNKFDDIATLMLAVTAEPEDGCTITTGRMSLLSNENKDALNALYPHPHKGCRNSTKNQGIDFIASIIAELHQYSYFDDIEIPTNLRNILADILLVKFKRK